MGDLRSQVLEALGLPDTEGDLAAAFAPRPPAAPKAAGGNPDQNPAAKKPAPPPPAEQPDPESETEVEPAEDGEDLNNDGEISEYENRFADLADELGDKDYEVEAQLLRQIAQAIDDQDWESAALYWSHIRPFLAHPAFGPRLASAMNAKVYSALENGGTKKPTPLIGRLGEQVQAKPAKPNSKKPVDDQEPEE